MSKFSERYFLIPEKRIQFKSVDKKLFNRIWNIFYKREYEYELWTFGGGEIDKTEHLLDFFGCTYDFPSGSLERNNNIDNLKKFLEASMWYCIYDFVEKYVELFDDASSRKELEKERKNLKAEGRR